MSGVACYSKKSGPRIVIGDKPVCIIIMSTIRDVGYGWAGWSIALPGFGRSVNPIISTKGQLISEQISAVLNFPKMQQNVTRISALASKMGKIKKVKVQYHPN